MSALPFALQVYLAKVDLERYRRLGWETAVEAMEEFLADLTSQVESARLVVARGTRTDERT